MHLYFNLRCTTTHDRRRVLFCFFFYNDPAGGGPTYNCFETVLWRECWSCSCSGLLLVRCSPHTFVSERFPSMAELTEKGFILYVGLLILVTCALSIASACCIARVIVVLHFQLKFGQGRCDSC